MGAAYNAINLPSMLLLHYFGGYKLDKPCKTTEPQAASNSDKICLTLNFFLRATDTIDAWSGKQMC